MSKLNKYLDPRIRSSFYIPNKLTFKFPKRIRQVGGDDISILAENNEWFKTQEGEVLRINNAPTHDEKVIFSDGQKRVTDKKGGIELNNVQSVISATQENRNQNDKSYTEKDEEIKIKPKEALQLIKNFGFKINKPVKSLSPGKLLDLTIEAKSKFIDKLNTKTNSLSVQGQNSIKANKSIANSLPTDEDLYDEIFKIQENKKVSGEIQEDLQQGGLSTSVNLKKPYFINNNKTIYPKKSLELLLTKDKANISDLDELGNEMSDYDWSFTEKYNKDPNMITFKDTLYNKRNGVKVPESMIKDMIYAAKQNKIDPIDFLAVGLRESDLGYSRVYTPNNVFSNNYANNLGIENLDQENLLISKDDYNKAQTYVNNAKKYPFWSEADTFKKKTEKLGLRGYNYGDPDYANKVAQEREILKLPENYSKLLKYLQR